MSLKMRFYLALAIGCGILSVRLNAASPATNFAATPLPPIESWTPCMTVDEPLGPTYSIGFTLWHLNHNPETIQRFQAYVKSHKLDVGSPSRTPPKSTYQILIDPELIPMNELPSWGWKKEGGGVIRRQCGRWSLLLPPPTNFPHRALPARDSV